MRWTLGEEWTVVRLMIYVMPWFLMALIPGFITALVLKRVWVIAAIAAAVVLLGPTYWSGLNLDLAKAQEGEGIPLRLMTYNVLYSTDNTDQIVALIEAKDPDIIALQEVTWDISERLIAELADTHPHYVMREGSRWLEVMIISRYPLTKVPIPDAAWRTISAEVESPGGTITVWNTHPRPTIRPRGWQSQVETMMTIANELPNESNPVIVMGDFNTTPGTTTYNAIAAHLTDVHRAVGWGFGFTFADFGAISFLPSVFQAIGPVVRIDYIFVSDEFTPVKTWVESHGYGSDHLPVIADVQLNVTE